MKKNILLILSYLISNSTFAQVDTTLTDTTKSIYGELTVRKFYNIKYFSETRDGFTTYEINDIKVKKSTYDKYHYTWENMATCKPCILMTYDINDKLLYKGIQYTDCSVGFRILYYPNGKVKVIEHYKENSSGDWKNAWLKGFCSIKEGAFTYFNEKGEKLYSEYWKDGEFIKQIPEQNKTEIWTFDLILDSIKITNQVLKPKQVSEIKIVPKFKNGSTSGTNITIEFEVSEIGHIGVSRTFTLDSFKTIDVQKMFDEAGIKSSERPSCDISIYNNSNLLFRYGLIVKPKRKINLLR